MPSVGYQEIPGHDGCGCRRNKKYLLFLGTVVIILSCLVASRYYQTKFNRDLIDSLKTANQHADSSQIESIQLSDNKQNQSRSIDIEMSQEILQECQGTQLHFPDIDYALMGYNILRGFPLAIGHDPGFTYPIFAAKYENGKHTADCRYNVPQGLVVVPDVSCITSFTSKVIQTQYEFANSLSASASASGGGWGGHFSASAGYKESSSEISIGESVYIISSASCNYYFSKLVKRAPPPLDPVFLGWVKRLSKTNSTDTYIEFIDTYGTHFTTEVTFGARYTYKYKMSSTKYEQQMGNGTNIAASASYSGLVRVSGGASLDTSQKIKPLLFLN